uniref:Protein kinase domain-containing protein n=1 Tax=Quercus lobata TaxID=97700 RepID=A0A7N2R590_QUELO
MLYTGEKKSTLSVCLILRGDFSVIAGAKGHSLMHHFKLVGMKGISECISKLLRTSGKRRSDSDKTKQSYSVLPCRRFSLVEIKAATNNFDDNLVIGWFYGKTEYKGFIDDRTISVAIKRVNFIKAWRGFRELRTEMLVLCQLRHPNLVRLIGYCIEDEQEGFLVYELMVNGNLASHLYATNPDPCLIPGKRRLQICVGVARGLHYLHTGLKHTVVHCGVNLRSILLNEKWEAKLSDFRWSKMGPPSLSKALIRIETDTTNGFMGYEYSQSLQVSDKSDVSSFGAVLLLLLSGRNTGRSYGSD